MSATKLALLPLALTATWATAQADDFKVSVTPTQSLDHLYLFTERQTTPPSIPMPGSPTVGSQAITADLGPLVAGSTYSTTISTSYGTSAGFPLGGGDALEIGVLGVAGDGQLVLSSQATGGAYRTLFTGATQADAKAGATSGSLATATSLFPAGSTNALYGQRDAYEGAVLPASVNLLAFDASGASRSIGTASIQAVPEPASWAALGFGALAMARRRRK